MREMMNVAMDAAREAGAVIRERLDEVLRIDTKADGSLVSNVDREAERIITERIRASFPGHGIAGEEGGASNGEAEYVWVIDPLDGTHNYVRGVDIFGVSIGIRYRGAYHAGVIFMPMEGSLYAAERGSGAFKNSRRIRVSSRASLAECSIGIDSDLRHGLDGKLAFLQSLGTRAFNFRMFGSSARTLSYVAEGKLDAVVEFQDKTWDFAAGVVLVEEAGGRITTFSGKPLPYAATDYVASNGHIHEEMLGLMGGR
jgi:myo-inositol-1(or 4)-monophosphatase